MKKVLVILMAVLMVLSLAACGTKEEAAPTTDNPGTEPGNTDTGNTDTGNTEPEASTDVLKDDGHEIWDILGQQTLTDGTINGWGDKDAEVFEKSALTPASMADVKAIDENVYKALAAKEVKYLYVGEVIMGVNDAGWSTGCLIDGKMFKANGSYAIKIGQCTVDVDGDNKVYSVDQWISDPKTAHVEVLTPATLFMPAWQEEKDENG